MIIFFFGFQASSIPCVLSGKDIVIAAETGSGKTYSYLVPLIERLHCSHYSSVNTAFDQQVSPPRQLLLVLCPNIQLCEQVVRMANCLCGENAKPFVNVAAVCGRQVVTRSYLLPAILSAGLLLYKLSVFFSKLCTIYETKVLFVPGMANSRT